jgi:hypothetical protein
MFKSIVITTKSQGMRMPEKSWDSSMLDLANFGFFLISVGVAFVAVPDLVSHISNFIADITMVEASPNIFLPAPAGFHPQLYYAFLVYSVTFGLLHIPLLAGRFYFKDRLRKKASTLGSVVFQLGAAYAGYLLLSQGVAWFGFIGIIIIMGGLSLVIENLIVLAASRKR